MDRHVTGDAHSMKTIQKCKEAWKQMPYNESEAVQ